MRGRNGRKAKGFTLVELLVVIGIIALLVSILLPVLGRARDKANQVSCLNNVRQIAIAFRMYAGDNKDWCPWAAPLNPTTDQPADWIHWRTGIANAGLASSAIAPYLGGNGVTKGDALVKIFRCPSDRLENRPSFSQYAYSYSMNIYFGSNGNFPVVGGKPVRLSTTRNASEKVIIAEENEVTINDGYWVPGRPNDFGTSPDPATWICEWDWLSIRHDNSVKEAADKTPRPVPLDQLNNKGRKGVVSFADGHAEVVPRDYAHHPRHVLPRL